MKKESQPRNVRVAAVHALASISIQLVRAKSEPSQTVERAMELLRDLAAGDPTSSRHGELDANEFDAYLRKKFGTLEPAEGPPGAVERMFLRCGQCGDPFHSSACGPTHALLKMETLQAWEEAYKAAKERSGGTCDEACVQEVRQKMADFGVKQEEKKDGSR